MEDLKTIETVDTSPFKRLCMTIGELPASFVDSMTYYECLAWLVNYLQNTVIPAVNNNAEATQELQTAFVTLKNFVDNYFDNLNVQEEINNKLDEMADDGTLQQLMGVYIDNEIVPRINLINNKVEAQNDVITGQNANIQAIRNELDSVASGSPLTATSTDDMTDTTRVYVNTTDGKWYYYDGDSWEIGGTYQATEDSTSLATVSADIINLYNPTLIQEGYIDSTGFHANATYKSAKVAVTGGVTYYLYRTGEFYSRTGDYIGFYDSNNVLTTIPFGQNITTVGGKKFIKVVTPVDCQYVIFNVKLTTYDNINSTYFSIYPTTNSTKGYDQEVRYKINSLALSNNLIKETDKILNYYINTSGTVTAGDNISAMAKVPVSANSDYYLYKPSGFSVIPTEGVGFFASDGTLISFAGFSSLDSVYTSGGNITKKITTPANTTYIIFNLKLTGYDDTNGTILSTYPTEYEMKASDNLLREKVDNITTLNLNRLKNKKWYCMGDSITEHNFRATQNYQDFIAQRCSCTVVNGGTSGAGFVKTVGTVNMCTKADDLDGTEGYDYITVFAGTNDINQTIGQPTDTGTSTVYGAVKYTVNKLIETYPNAKIAFITPTPRSNNYGTINNPSLNKIRNAIIEVCGNYSIPVLDLYTTSGLRPWNDDNNEEFFSCEEAPTGDGLHPNADGQEWISYPIQDMLEKL